MKYLFAALLVIAWSYAGAQQSRIQAQLDANNAQARQDNDRLFTQDQARTNYSIRQVNDLYTAEYYRQRRLETQHERDTFDARYEAELTSIGLRSPEQILEDMRSR